MNKIIYLDAAASSLKPQAVIQDQTEFLTQHYANAGRGVCARSSYVDQMLDRTRQRVAKFINAQHSDQIVFTSGTTDGMNRIVQIIRETISSAGSKKVVCSDLDHHSARIPWEEAAHRGDFKFAVCPLDDDYNLDVSGLRDVDILVITAMSNVLGRPQDVSSIIRAARKINPDVITIVDAAQYVAHLPIDVVEWDCDFMCFSGHKIGSDTGLGVMYIKKPSKWNPDKFGGGMVVRINGGLDTNNSQWTLADAPAKFEAGTLPLTQIAGLNAAIDNIEKNRDQHGLISQLYTELAGLEKINLITRADDSILSFTVDGMHCFDFGSLMGANNICVRVGNMCASWLHQLLGVDGTVRISTGFWNTPDEIKQTAKVIKNIVKSL